MISFVCWVCLYLLQLCEVEFDVIILSICDFLFCCVSFVSWDLTFLLYLGCEVSIVFLTCDYLLFLIINVRCGVYVLDFVVCGLWYLFLLCFRA